MIDSTLPNLNARLFFCSSRGTAYAHRKVCLGIPFSNVLRTLPTPHGVVPTGMAVFFMMAAVPATLLFLYGWATRVGVGLWLAKKRLRAPSRKVSFHFIVSKKGTSPTRPRNRWSVVLSVVCQEWKDLYALRLWPGMFREGPWCIAVQCSTVQQGVCVFVLSSSSPSS